VLMQEHVRRRQFHLVVRTHAQGTNAG
jgi:hypothetical protein